jgi:transcriptional regulator with XRE-family HTH domain
MLSATYADRYMGVTMGARIRQLREQQDVSLREFAKKLGDISAAHVSDIELGRRFPSESLLKKIAGLLRVSVKELKEHDSRPPVDELKRLSAINPAFGFALRKLVDREVTPEDILRLTRSKPSRDNS